MNAIVIAPICPLHAEPSRESTLLDEALCGMVVEILDESAPGWYRVRTHYRYEGMVPGSCLVIGDDLVNIWQSQPKQVVLHKNFCDVLSQPRVQGSRLATLPRGALVSPVGQPDKGWQLVRLADGRLGYVPAGILGAYHTQPLSREEGVLRKALTDAAMLYRGTHYRWGGKSPQGIDCSGLVSMAYLLCGIVIYRDADIREGFPIHEIPREQLQPGDLIFLPGHVMMHLGENRYCHSTGRAGDDGFAVNSFDPGAPDYREDLKLEEARAGSYFSYESSAFIGKL